MGGQPGRGVALTPEPPAAPRRPEPGAAQCAAVRPARATDGPSDPRCPPRTQRTCRRPDHRPAGPRRRPSRANVSIVPLRVRILRRDAPRLHRMCSPGSTFDAGPRPHVRYAPGEHPPRAATGAGSEVADQDDAACLSTPAGVLARFVDGTTGEGNAGGVPAGVSRAGGRCPDCNKRASRRLAGAVLPRSVAGAAAKAGSGVHSAPVGRDSASREAGLLHGEQRRRRGADPAGRSRRDDAAWAGRRRAGRLVAGRGRPPRPGAWRGVGRCGAARVWRRPSAGTLSRVRGISSAQRRCCDAHGRCVSR
jgi:hypothetical protein